MHRPADKPGQAGIRLTMDHDDSPPQQNVALQHHATAGHRAFTPARERRSRFPSRVVRIASLLALLAGHSWLTWTSEVQAQATQPGLASLSDERLLNELAARGLSQLLDRAFEVNNIPAAEQEARRTMLALQQLADGKANFTRAQQQALLARVTSGIDAALPKMADPEAMMQQARVLIDAGATRQIDTLELWGDNLATRQALKPVARTIGALYDRAAEAAGQLVESIGNQPNPDAQRLEQMYNLQQLATFNARMSDYLLAMGLEPASGERTSIADRGINYLKLLDTPDQPIRPAVRLRIGKLQMARNDFSSARQSLSPLASDDAFEPKAAPIERYQAFFFLVANELAARNSTAAQTELDRLLQWQSTNLSGDANTRASAEAASKMLQYRIHELNAQLAGNNEARKRANDAAVATLSKLLADRPDLAGPINELLTARLPPDAPLDALDPLLLQALVRRAEEQRLRPAGEAVDQAVLKRGIAAANELLSRPASAQIDAQLLDNCRFVVPFLLQRASEPVPAATAFLDYAAAVGKTERGVIALDNAQAAIAALRSDRAEDEAVRTLYERFLPLAIDSFGRTEFAFEYARRLQLLNQPTEAIAYFKKVPEAGARATTARFLQMLCEKQRLDDLQANDPSRAGILAEIQRLADVVSTLSSATTNALPDASAQSMLIRTKLLAAELARAEQQNPQRAIDMLADIETSLSVVGGGDELLPEILLVRVQSYIALGRSAEATDTLVRLLAKREGGQGAAIVYSLLQKLNEELDEARAAGDTARVATAARNRAELSGFLVKWARESADPGIRKFTYRYMVFDAASKHLAADAEPDPAAQRNAHEAALGLYRSLQSPENFSLYRGTLDASAAATTEYDPAVSFGIAMLCFDLGQLAEARDRLSRLLSDRKLGTPVVTVADESGTGTREADNDQYWQAVLRFVQANDALNEQPEQNRAYLLEQYIRWGSRVGGKKWRAEFDQLRQRLGLNVPSTQPSP